MKVTKYEHATLVVTTADQNLVIDPGMFLTPPDFANTVAVVITHEHGDHWSEDNLRRILEISPDATIYGPQGVADAAAGFDVHVVKAGDAVEAGPFALRFFGEKHAVIHESIPVPDNLGVLVNDELYYPGDSYTVPDGVEVGTLAAPVGAPWLKIGDAMDFVLAVKPRRAFFSHEMTLSVAGKSMQADRLKWATEQNGGTWIPLEVGESVDL
ncbi:MBL fold metallo-hydrolase [Pseudolysinimonas sp.]|uniref:MBL fold metallo-hydrolase n=1 Tax=Pseudolysinimonas sp. TaxID=2680009 RepID=UPI003F7D9D00